MSSRLLAKQALALLKEKGAHRSLYSSSAIYLGRQEVGIEQRQLGLHAPRSRSDVSSSQIRSFASGQAASTKLPDSILEADVETRRRILNRMLYRSRQRGYLELDLLLGKWATANVATMNNEMLEGLVILLDEENPDLWKWLTNQGEPPADLAENPVFRAIHAEVSRSLDIHSDPLTRAAPGANWVRGWDDRDKPKQQVGAPPGGNQ